MMMFLELTFNLTEEKILININSVCAILPSEEMTDIYIGEDVYRVKESYEDIVKAINNWDRLMKA